MEHLVHPGCEGTFQLPEILEIERSNVVGIQVLEVPGGQDNIDGVSNAAVREGIADESYFLVEMKSLFQVASSGFQIERALRVDGGPDNTQESGFYLSGCSSPDLDIQHRGDIAKRTKTDRILSWTRGFADDSLKNFSMDAPGQFSWEDGVDVTGNTPDVFYFYPVRSTSRFTYFEGVPGRACSFPGEVEEGKSNQVGFCPETADCCQTRCIGRLLLSERRPYRDRKL
jgi:hypothetical protein